MFEKWIDYIGSQCKVLDNTEPIFESMPNYFCTGQDQPQDETTKLRNQGALSVGASGLATILGPTSGFTGLPQVKRGATYIIHDT